MTIVVCPSFATVTEAIAYLDDKGCSAFYLWRGPDGLVRGHGTKQIEVPGMK
jgi:hypothetical protein